MLRFTWFTWLVVLGYLDLLGVHAYLTTAPRTRPALPKSLAHIKPISRGLSNTLLYQSSAVSSSVTSSSPATSAPTTRTTATASTANSLMKRWESFDYLQHWYAVGWVDDLNRGPTQVSLFDVPYVVAITTTTTAGSDKKTQQVTALEDRCPHKGAALSEGRITSTGLVQCAYHGWSFDDTGTCRDIPQSHKTNGQYSSRTCAKAVPAIIHQGLVWLWPGPVPKDGIAQLPSPPTVPEMNDSQYKVTNKSIRDFPCIDWTLLLSNIMDPDHGMFAHQSTAFDWYSASREMPMTIDESFGNAGKDWIMTSQVPAQEKVLARDKLKRGNTAKNDRDSKQPLAPDGDTIIGTTVFHAPTHVTMSRRDATTGQTNFVAVFWVCPTGTGRSRFLSAAVGKMPFTLPRWLTHVNINGFLDQDSLLVASQQPLVLSTEAKYYQQQEQTSKQQQQESKGQNGSITSTDNPVTHNGDNTQTKSMGPRASIFCYQSPSDRSVRLIDQFWDATVARAPNRVRTLASLHKAGLLSETPPRTIVLDRAAQHLRVCPDSQDAVRNCQRVRTAGLVIAAATVIYRAMMVSSTSASVTVPLLLVVASLSTAWVAEWIRQQYYYSYTEENRNKDLATIPTKIWLDPH